MSSMFNRPCIACTPYGDDDELDLDDTHNGVVIDDGDDDDDADRLLDSAGGVTGAGFDLLARMDAAGEFI
jgi:hypothetical protein